MTIGAVLDQFPSLQGCVCEWKEELCDSIQELATQCQRKPGAVFSVFPEIKDSYQYYSYYVFAQQSHFHEQRPLCHRTSANNKQEKINNRD